MPSRLTLLVADAVAHRDDKGVAVGEPERDGVCVVLTETVEVTLTVHVEEERGECVFDVVTLAELVIEEEPVVDGDGENVGVRVADADDEGDLE